MRIGYFLSSEQTGPQDLVASALRAHESGFDGLWISDHFHPWIEEQGHSPFVWTVIGAIAQAVPGAHITTAVTCPTIRIHPAVIAQAAATAAVLLDGKFSLGLGTGEALNEHIFGDAWPEAADRRDMLEEAIQVIRQLWSGEMTSHRGAHYRVENAKIFDLPETLPDILVSGFGPHATDLAARIGDGFVTVFPDAEAISRFKGGAQRGRRVEAGTKVCWHHDSQTARELTHRLWPTDALPGELLPILPTPAHFAQAAELVSEELIASQVPCGPDIDEHLEALRAYEKAGVDHLYVQQIGPISNEFFAAYQEHVLPRFH